MDYGKIVSTGWKQAWQHKTLWIFGFFISGGGMSVGNNIGDKFKFGRKTSLDLPGIETFLMEHLALILVLLMIAIVAFIIWIILSTISVGGLIDAAGQMKRGEEYSFGRAFKSGTRYFWRIFGLGLLTFIVGFAFIILLILFGVIAFLLAVPLGILSLLILIPIMIVGIFLLTITQAMAQRYIILKDRQVFDAIEDGFNLWKSHLGPSLLYTLIYMGIGIAVMIGMFILIFMAVIPFVAVAFVNLIIAILVGVPFILLFLLIFDGLTGSAMHLMTTEFYFQLLDEGKPVMAPPMPETGFTPPSTPPPTPTPEPPPTPPPSELPPPPPTPENP